MSIHKYNLCKYCHNRLFQKSKHNDYFNKKRSLLDTKQKCYICKNIFYELNYHIDKILSIAKNYEFSTFSIGLKLKPSMMDRDDDIRSIFKLRGICSIKSKLNNKLSQTFSRKTNSKLDVFSPDIVITLDFSKNILMCKSKTIYVYGRYIKKSRHITQKQRMCKLCTQINCKFCICLGIYESTSIESKIIKLFHDNFKSYSIKLNYVGGEDKTSLVLGEGRPFFAKIIDPHIRNPKFMKFDDVDVTIHNLRMIKYIPGNQAFKSEVKLAISTENTTKNDDLKLLQRIKTVKFYDTNNKENQKNIYHIKWKLLTRHTFYIMMVVDGGFPIRKFINDPFTKPNLNHLIKNVCNCIHYDYYKIMSDISV
ncbi:MAG: hypothetical protein OXF77_01590 [Thaumarchaeota archaeon]|nr:hypothetical protein [Nitrososphaerota archaeon]